MKRSSLLILLVVVCAFGLRAQNFDLANNHLPVLSLDGLWRFHTGDNPSWARAEFDDSHWPLLRSDQNWAEQGYNGYSGVAWYRFKVTFSAGMDHVSILLPYILTSYEVYANGDRIGSYGKMPPRPVPYWGGGWFRTYALPANSSNKPVEIAIRVWHWPGWAANFGGGPSFGGALIGSTDEIEARNELSRGNHHWNLSSTMILALLQTLAGIGALVLFLLRRSEREYLWFGVLMLVSAASGWFTLSFVFSPWNQLVSGPLTEFFSLVAVSLAQIAFYRHLLKGGRTLLLKAAVACIFFTLLYIVVESYAVIDPTFQTGLSSTTVNLFEILLQLPMDVWILWLLFARARDNWLDARLLLAPVVLQVLAQLFQAGAIVTFNLGWQQTLGYNIIVLLRGPFQIELLQAVDTLFLIAIFAILILRFTRTRAQEERYAIEFDAARTVQQILIPEQRPQTPGFRIESEYRPAREVGGDFFQVIQFPREDSLLVVVGDVAGKGLQAGMLVAHIIGTIRNEATHTCDPTLIVAALNRQLAGQHHALATCLAIRLRVDGSATLVNAGHLPPYLNGKALPMEGALPLGTIEDIDFPVLHFQLAPGDTLILMTDGIVEAQRADGQLYGFDRIDEMLARGASGAALAAAAQTFGQEDDITILEISRLAAAPVV